MVSEIIKEVKNGSRQTEGHPENWRAQEVMAFTIGPALDNGLEDNLKKKFATLKTKEVELLKCLMLNLLNR